MWTLFEMRGEERVLEVSITGSSIREKLKELKSLHRGCLKILGRKYKVGVTSNVRNIVPITILNNWRSYLVVTR